MENEELQGKISALDKSSKLLDQKFVSLVKNSEKCNHMLEIIPGPSSRPIVTFLN